ncbi:hypothetical protein H6F43_03195 [Leptolyngbya sp. FACHB-36]|uniref:hypothetical protein n=1 Tax=Leptolyngbya sp. FACHB-36 TaxID=2692808 RepID=UPI0016800865|nr:hypothetical protein [Leptolyngbya sp. FACHB-36]MBD2019189.1 hypothetical protein [Leptolyngbya sp. FACHB-36]
MKDLEELLRSTPSPPTRPRVVLNTDWVEDHGLLIGGAIFALIALGFATPGLLENQRQNQQAGNELRPLLAEQQRQQALNQIAAGQNQIAEDRYKNPNCVAVQRVVSGEPAHRLDGTIVSAGSMVCDFGGGTGLVIAHPTGKFDPVTRQQIMRPIVTQVISSQGPEFQSFRKRMEAK